MLKNMVLKSAEIYAGFLKRFVSRNGRPFEFNFGDGITIAAIGDLHSESLKKYIGQIAEERSLDGLIFAGDNIDQNDPSPVDTLLDMKCDLRYLEERQSLNKARR